MRDWSIYNADTVLNGKDKDGNRLVLEFSKDFRERMGYNLDISCPKCFRNDFDKFLNKNNMSTKNKSSFKLKPMYNGIALGFGSKVFLSDDNITDELAEKFVKEHPKGLGLFSEYPQPKKEAEKKVNKKNA